MRFIKKDLTRFELYKPCFTPDGSGDTITTYDAPAVTEFHGNIQPFGEKRSSEAYGIDLKYAYVVYVPLDFGVAELDRICDGESFYEVKLVQSWKSYRRLLVEKVMSNERCR